MLRCISAADAPGEKAAMLLGVLCAVIGDAVLCAVRDSEPGEPGPPGGRAARMLRR